MRDKLISMAIFSVSDRFFEILLNLKMHAPGRIDNPNSHTNALTKSKGEISLHIIIGDRTLGTKSVISMLHSKAVSKYNLCGKSVNFNLLSKLFLLIICCHSSVPETISI